MSKLTADTITDEQIRDLFDASETEHRDLLARADAARERRNLCVEALNPGSYPLTSNGARARCAEILNARAEVVK